MIQVFEELVRRHGAREFFRFEDGGAQGQALRAGETVVSYAQARMSAIALMHQIAREGTLRGGYLAADMDNCPAFVYLLLACGYGGFKLITLNHRLTDAEKDERLATVEEAAGIAPVLLTERDVHEMINLGAEAETKDALVHSAQRAAALSELDDFEVIMFTSGTTGKAKGAILPSRAIMSSAYTFNGLIGSGEDVRWQVCLPLYHIGGLQMVVRSLLNGTPFVLYRRFEAPRVLADAQRLRVTHISVVDKILRDLMEWAEKGVHGGVSTLQAYRCILLGGAAPNANTIGQAQQLQLPVYSSYGMTETASLIALCPISDEGGSRLRLLPGYEACVVHGDDYGWGGLYVKGPGLFAGYVGTKLLLTADGFFLTGDTGLVRGRELSIGERTADMFVSGGENIYPEEIRRKLLAIPGVTDAYVYGAEDEKWGRRPVALVEMSDSEVGPGNAARLSREVLGQVREKLARIYQPDRLFAVDSFPRHGVGKIDRAALQARAECYLDVKRVAVHRIAQPFVQPVKTAKATLEQRESLIVELFDAEGRSGIGEDVAFSTPWYLPETIGDDLVFLHDYALPRVLADVYLHPEEAYASLMECPGADSHRMAIAAVETALWDLYGKRSQKTLRELIGARPSWFGGGGFPPCPPGMAPGGAVVGLMPVDETVQAVRQAVEQGYRRVKLKIAPGDDVLRVKAVQEAVPDAILMLDANQAYTEADIAVLHRIDELGCAGIEEPLNPHYEQRANAGIFDRLAKLQRQMQTTIYLDESIVTREDMRTALATPGIKGYVLKVGKFGGVLPALQFFEAVRARRAEVWMGGMFDTGVSKRLHAVFGLLDGVKLPGDICDSSRYFATDITEPPLRLWGAQLLLNPSEAPYGLGCSLNREALEQVMLDTSEYEWTGRRMVQRS